MKKLGLVILLFLGVTEIVYGFFWGRMRIYALEAPMVRQLGITPEHYKDFGNYVTILKDQCRIVAWFGALTVVIAVGGLILLFKSSNPPGVPHKS